MPESAPPAIDLREDLENHFIAYFRDRAVRLSTMRPVLRWLSIGVIALLIGSGILLAVPAIPAPLLSVGSSGGSPIQVSLVVYFFTMASFAIGWTLVLAAALALPRVPRLLVVAGAVGLLSSGPVSRLLASGQLGGPSAIEFWVRLLQLAALGASALWTALSALRTERQAAADDQTDARRNGRLAVWPAIVLVAGYYLAELAIALTYIASSSGGSQSGPLASAIAAQTRYLPTILAVVIYWGSTDFIEWGQATAEGMTAITRTLRSPALFFAIVAILAAAFLADLIRLFGLYTYLPSVVTSLVTIALVSLLVRFARVDADWPAQVPITALLVGVAFLFVFFQLATAFVAYLAPRLPPAELNPLYTGVSVSAAIALLVAALVVIERGRSRNRSDLRATGLFLAMMGLLFVALSVPQLANVFGLPVVRTTQLSVPALKFIVLPATLLALLWLALRGQLTRKRVAPFAVTLSLIMGLQVIAWFFFLLEPALSALSSVSVIVAALFFLAAILWDFLLSGDQVTNRSGPAVRRSVRVVLYLGYTLLSSATLVYLKSVHFAGSGQIVPLGSENEMLEEFGAVGLGLPLIAYAFIQGMGRLRRRTDEPDGEPQPLEPQLVGSPNSRGPRRSIRSSRLAISARAVKMLFVPFSAALLLVALVALASCGSSAAKGKATPTASPPLAHDTFARTNQTYWGTASDGQAWGGDANSLAAFSIADHAGQITTTDSPVSAVLGPVETTSEVTLTATLSGFTGSNTGPVLRWQDGNNWYKAYIDGTNLVLQKRVAGTYTNLAVTPFAATGGTSYTLHFLALGDTLAANVWVAGSAEPSGWMVTSTDDSFAAGRCGLRAQAAAGVTVRITSFAADVPTGPEATPSISTATPSPAATATAAAPATPTTRVPPRPTATPTPRPTATFTVIDPSTIAVPLFSQPDPGQIYKAQSVSNGVGTYSVPVDLTISLSDPRFTPPAVTVKLDYTDPIKNTGVSQPLVPNQTTTATFSKQCPASGSQTTMEFHGDVFVLNANGIVWQGVNASQPIKVSSTTIDFSLTC